MITTVPLYSSDERPGNKPYYIDPRCDNCGDELVLLDELEGRMGEEVWHDEFTCPQCRDGIYLDLPPQGNKELQRRLKEAKRGLLSEIRL
jgi:hypothetical protein